MTKLRLGVIPEDKPVKLTLEIPGEMMRELQDYAEVHARLTGLATPLPVERIVPAMIGRFIAADPSDVLSSQVIPDCCAVQRRGAASVPTHTCVGAERTGFRTFHGEGRAEYLLVLDLPGGLALQRHLRPVESFPPAERVAWASAQICPTRLYHGLSWRMVPAARFGDT